MHCISCGTFLTPGVRTCPNCGASVAPVAPIAPIATPQPGTFLPPERTMSAYDDAIPFTDQETPLPAAPASLTGEPSMEQMEFGAPPEAEPALPLLAVASPTPPRRTPLLVITTTLSVLSLLVIAVLVFLLIQNTRPVPTPPNQFTTSDPQAIYTQVTTKTPTISDAFNSQTSNTWKAFSTGNCSITGNALHATAPQGGNVLCESTTLTASNFACQVEITLTQGDIIGLIFRASSEKTYLIAFTTHGIYQLSSNQNSTSSFTILAQGINSAISTGYGQPNLLTIIARGSMFYFYVNKHFIISTSDPTATSGMIGITSAGTVTNALVDATFNHLQLWNL